MDKDAILELVEGYLKLTIEKKRDNISKCYMISITFLLTF